jgi:hypothetical protein
VSELELVGVFIVPSLRELALAWAHTSAMHLELSQSTLERAEWHARRSDELERMSTAAMEIVAGLTATEPESETQ